MAMRRLRPGTMRECIDDGDEHEQREDDPSHPRERQHRRQDAAGPELRAESGEVGPNVLRTQEFLRVSARKGNKAVFGLPWR